MTIITAAVKSIDTERISLRNVTIDGRIIKPYHCMYTGIWAQDVKAGDTIRFEAEVSTYTRRETHDGTHYENVTRWSIRKPKKTEIMKPA